MPLEARAVNELLKVLDIQRALEDSDLPARIERVAVTPDFHKGAGIPVGTVMQTGGFIPPAAVGHDVGCGMRLHLTSLTHDALEPHLDALEHQLRALFFEGRRQIALTGVQRQAVLLEGVSGLLQVPGQGGLWAELRRQDWQRELDHGDPAARRQVPQLYGLRDWIGAPHDVTSDSQSGSLGGGNHFAEIQVVHRILDPVAAHQWGLKKGMVSVMIHSGALGVGHFAGQMAQRLARDAWSKGAPAGALCPLVHAEAPQAFGDALNVLQTAAHFAAVNRLWLALMVKGALEGLTRELDFPLLYDAAHTFIWPREDRWIHRKGATPARGFGDLQNTAFASTGEPVLVPGSMGASSFVLAGRENTEALWSASHGAGRQRTRGGAMDGDDQAFAQFLEDFRVVTPLDWKRARQDIRQRKLAELKEEAPFAYKEIGPVIETLNEAGMARSVAELRPLLTVKG
ncbi:RtcB family protein (plasmid) [Deinococcus taeanensis]|uniref:RtcB family protein n=1 Tax=Deinococcus taeanensis TaxID=2737050 RepID=UPI001CDBC93D|nr:RtcB family protein [Deinococcus taeanensis]UBV44691.1 RtcB family protein [Deinococcus taeanensis]